MGEGEIGSITERGGRFDAFRRWARKRYFILPHVVLVLEMVCRCSRCLMLRRAALSQDRGRDLVV